MAELIPIYSVSFATPVAPQKNLGIKGVFKWIDTDQLVIDPKYQRPVREDGRKSIRRIVENFDWAYFSPCIVSQRPNGKYAVIDGQHRAIAARTHGGIDKIPCLVISGNENTEARAFAIINGQVTSVMSTQIYYARLAGKEPRAVKVDRVCQAAEVKVLKTPTGGYKVGETLAIGTLEQCLDRYGEETLVPALQIITQTDHGNPGYLRSAVILAFCEFLNDNPKWRDAGEKLFKAVETTGIQAIYYTAQKEKLAKGGSLRSHLYKALAAALRVK
jgi:hypothetical protein